MSTSPASPVAVSLARLAVAVMMYEAACVRGGFQPSPKLSLLAADANEALMVARAALRAAGMNDLDVKSTTRATISEALREVALPRANS